MNDLVMCRPRDDIEENDHASVFFAGTIDMGNSDDWQTTAFEYLRETKQKATVYNPRRVVFDDNEAEVGYQIKWELSRIDKSDVVFFNFLAGSKSPITFLELGLVLRSQHDTGVKPIVVCPPEFYRYQNVKITCEDNGVSVIHAFEEGLSELRWAVLDENLRRQA